MCVIMDHKKKSNLPVLLNHSELQKLRTDAGSCVEVKTCAHHITLHPFHLSNIANSIKEILNERVAKYSAEFGGILLGFENIKIFGSKAPMYDDMCFMHQKIEADFYIFKPTIGCRLNGVIIKKSQDHIGCLVHKLFNISLPKPEGDDNWLGFKAQIGQEVQFQVSFMNLDARLPYIKGVLLTIISEDSGISTSDETAHPKKKKSKKSTKDKVDGSQPEAESVKKKKLKKKKTLPEEDILNIIFDAPEKKKKSKKDKKSKSEVPEDQNNIDQIEDLKAQPKQKKSKRTKQNLKMMKD
ncbi:DNA-directed RNA polymerase I subunit RPA43 isoform X2 [Atheta coriaria]|uniref:DNA-directed RNA polymerase I subunit RPA43 isoform X2 n=1 Tax=Dalotia coriaria TaxID=877792 RepID=UPI0031F39614